MEISLQEKMCRLVVSMEEKFEESLRHEKEQLEIVYKEKLKDAELYERMAMASSGSRRASLAKISTMSDLLSIKVPTLEAIETMERDDMIEKFLVLLDHFYRAVEEIRTLRSHLREAQDTNDQLELEKLRFEESFKRTIVMQEQQENLMSKRIQDLTNKLLVSEKSVKQLKERRHSKKNSLVASAAAAALAASDKSGNSSSQNNEWTVTSSQVIKEDIAVDVTDDCKYTEIKSANFCQLLRCGSTPLSNQILKPKLNVIQSKIDEGIRNLLLNSKNLFEPQI